MALECGTPKATLRGYIGLSVVLVGVGGYLVWIPEPGATIPGIVLILLFSTTAGAFLYKHIYWRPDVLLDDQGIEDVRQGFGVIPWSEVRDLHTGRLGRGQKSIPYLAITVDDPNKYISRAKPLRKYTDFLEKLIGPELSIGFISLEPDIDVVCEYIEQRIGIPVERCH